MEEKRTNLFANFAFYFHGSVPGAGFLKSSLLQRHGAAVADAHTLDWALHKAPCPSGGPESCGKRGRPMEVVVICGSRAARDVQEARAKALAEIKELLGKTSLICSECRKCHLLCTPVTQDGVPFVHKSIQIHSLQTQVAS